MTKILVPVDFSDTSKNALHYATKVFNQTSLEVTVLTIYGAESTALLMKSIDDILIDDAKSQLKVLLDDVKKEAPNVVFKTKLAKNYTVSTITTLGDSGDYDYIVMGTKGASGLKEVFLGSVAGGVVANTKAPVIVVPMDYTYSDLNSILLSIGKDDINDTLVLEPLKTIVNHHNSELEVLHISDNDQPKLEDTLSSISDLKPKFTYKKSSGDLNQQINVHISNNAIDLLCLLRTKKDFFHRLFNGSITLKQTFDSAVPLLILHE